MGRGEAVVRDEKNRLARRKETPKALVTEIGDITAAEVAVKNWTEV